MHATRNKLIKFSQTLIYSFKHPRLVKNALGDVYSSIAVAEGRVPCGELSDIVPSGRDIELKRFEPHVEGNVTVFEVACLSLLVRHLQPSVILEIGTFNGNTTLQLAANTPPQAKVYTLDLPWGVSSLDKSDKNDARIAASERRRVFRFVGSDVESKIKCLYGDSLLVNFSDLLEGAKADFIFIDAGHTYECVKNDTQKAFSVLKDGGTIVWHDYGGAWPGVYRYLNELSKTKALLNLNETSLVLYQDQNKREKRR